MSEERFELSTNGLKGHCSAIELLARSGPFYHAPLVASTACCANVIVISSAFWRSQKLSLDLSLLGERAVLFKNLNAIPNLH